MYSVDTTYELWYRKQFLHLPTSMVQYRPTDMKADQQVLWIQDFMTKNCNKKTFLFFSSKVALYLSLTRAIKTEVILQKIRNWDLVLKTSSPQEGLAMMSCLLEGKRDSQVSSLASSSCTCTPHISQSATRYR